MIDVTTDWRLSMQDPHYICILCALHYVLCISFHTVQSTNRFLFFAGPASPQVTVRDLLTRPKPGLRVTKSNSFNDMMDIFKYNFYCHCRLHLPSTVSWNIWVFIHYYSSSVKFRHREIPIFCLRQRDIDMFYWATIFYSLVAKRNSWK